MTKQNWIVRVYDAKDKLIDERRLLNLTDNEAYCKAAAQCDQHYRGREWTISHEC